QGAAGGQGQGRPAPRRRRPGQGHEAAQAATQIGRESPQGSPVEAPGITAALGSPSRSSTVRWNSPTKCRSSGVNALLKLLATPSAESAVQGGKERAYGLIRRKPLAGKLPETGLEPARGYPPPGPQPRTGVLSECCSSDGVHCQHKT